MTQLINFSLTQVTAIEAFRILSIEWALGSFSKILICGVRKTRKIPWEKKGRTCYCLYALFVTGIYIETEDQRPTGSSFCRNAPQSNHKTKTLAKKRYLTLKQWNGRGSSSLLSFVYSCQVPGSNDFENRSTPPRGRQKKYIQNWRIRQTVLSLNNWSMFWLNFTKICLLHTPYFLLTP